MVARLAVLALVAVLDTVLVHKRNRHHFHILTQPSPVGSIGQDGFEKPLQTIAGHHLAGVMSAGQQNAVLRLAVQFARVHALDGSILSALAQLPDG